MFGSQISFPITATILADQGDETLPLWVAPAACEIVSWYAIPGATITAGAGTGLQLTLQNGGTVGTATAALGTIGSGTADTGWVADTVRQGSLVASPQLAAGEALTVKYDETGTVNAVFTHVTVNVRYGAVSAS